MASHATGSTTVTRPTDFLAFLWPKVYLMITAISSEFIANDFLQKYGQHRNDLSLTQRVELIADHLKNNIPAIS